MSKKTGSGSTRSHTQHFLVGPEQLDMGKEARSGKLPCTREVLQYFFYRKNTPNFKYKPVSGAICCPLKIGTTSSSCGNNLQFSPSSECVV